MGFLLRVLDEGGSIVEEMVADKNFNPVRAGLESVDFPVMGTLDPYRDTSLDFLQCELLEGEVRRARAELEQKGVSGEFILELIRLCEISRAMPRRRLVFIGD